jgi:hypothetical protein
MKKNKTRTLIDLALELCTIILIWGAVMLLLGTFGGCASIRTGDGPAKQQNFSAPNQTSGKGFEIPVDQIDLNQDGMIDATEQTIITSTGPDVLLTFGVITGSVFLSILVCAWMANRTSRKDTINKAAAEAMVESEDLIGHNDRPI